MFNSINPRSTIPVYTQVQNLVLFAIASGKLKSGDALPPLSELAKTCEVNINTVIAAYRNICVMGIVRSGRGRRTFINTDVESKCREQMRDYILQRFYEVVNEAKSTGMSLKDVKEICASSFEKGEGTYGGKK